MKRAVIISGAPHSDLAAQIKSVPKDAFIICADAGLSACRAVGLCPNLVVGDFDTLGAVPTGTFEVVALPSEKDCTDTFFACQEAVHRGFKQVDMYCAIGSRVDHTYANFLCLNYFLQQGVSAVIHNTTTTAFLTDRCVMLTRGEFRFLSLFPFLSEVTDLTLRGVKYPLTKHQLQRDSALCISNEFVEEQACIEFATGTLLIILTND